MPTAVKIAVMGRVQGVGFRPFVFQLAQTYQLKGTVQNNMDGVKIQIEGEGKKVQEFLTDLEQKAPRLAKIDQVIVKEDKMQYFTDFTIIESERSGKSMLVIPIDSAVCDDCLKEMNDPADFRYQYPFINCTQCGPRYTIIEELPYDRPYTTMKGFPMCPDCRREYEDPMNRRHHAQPIACPKCGPKVQLLNKQGTKMDVEHPIQEAVKLLKGGQIIAVKGIGGYHLCCDARNDQAVQTLRKRKKRPLKPLAIMAGSLSVINDIAFVSEVEENQLKSPESPIVVLRKKATDRLSSNIAPGMSTVGVMLPYTPLHHLLFNDPELSCLVMTSANPSGMPMLYQNQDSLAYLNGIVDYYLEHNREILHPVDDSVIQINGEKLDFLRRSRGYVPDPFSTAYDVTGIIAFGGQQKTTFTIGRNKQIFIGPHIGDLENLETLIHYKKELDHLLKWIDTPKQVAVIDAHPGYQVRNLVKAYDFDVVMEVQHHHAHMAACLDEHHIDGQAFGIILDGTGYGLDGNIWGFEVFYGDAEHVTRMAHLHYTPLPGGEKCIREPWRNAAAMLMSLHGEEGKDLAKQIFSNKTYELDILQRMMATNTNTVQAGTCGRLFDAVSALCGVTLLSSYDGEAAIRLAELADQWNDRSDRGTYDYELYWDQHLLTFDFSKMIKEIAQDVLAGTETARISTRFHETLVKAIVSALIKLHDAHPNTEKTVVLSGGSFHNRFLRNRISVELAERGFKVYSPEKVPCNDGGLSYGQLVIAAAKRRASKCVSEYQQK